MRGAVPTRRRITALATELALLLCALGCATTRGGADNASSGSAPGQVSPPSGTGGGQPAGSEPIVATVPLGAGQAQPAGMAYDSTPIDFPKDSAKVAGDVRKACEGLAARIQGTENVVGIWVKARAGDDSPAKASKLGDDRSKAVVACLTQKGVRAALFSPQGVQPPSDELSGLQAPPPPGAAPTKPKAGVDVTVGTTAKIGAAVPPPPPPSAH